MPVNIEYNYSYFPVLFPSEEITLDIKDKLSENNINARRYFYPSLNKLPYLTGDPCPVSENSASRILCLPLYNELSEEDVRFISRIVNDNLA